MGQQQVKVTLGSAETEVRDIAESMGLSMSSAARMLIFEALDRRRESSDARSA